MPQSKERHAEYMREKRGSQVNMTPKERITFIQGELGPGICYRIEKACIYFKTKQHVVDREGRYESAYRYHTTMKPC